MIKKLIKLSVLLQEKKLRIFFFRCIIKIKKQKNMKKILIKLILKILKSKKRKEIRLSNTPNKKGDYYDKTHRKKQGKQY